MDKRKKYHFRVDYDYDGAKGAWFDCDAATHQELAKVLATVFNGDNIVYNMTIRNLTHALWTNEPG